MAGLAGILDFSGGGVHRSALAQASRRLAAGPRDVEGWFSEGPACLVHRSQHLPATPQPLVSSRYVVLLDGWIYDHTAVAQQAGHPRRVASDVEALLIAWQKWGVALTQRVDGEFAAAIWDRDAQSLTLFRDCIGARPLFFCRQGQRFAFASRLPALLGISWVPCELAREHLSEYLSFRVVHAPRTLLRDIHQIEPAHWLRARQGEVEQRRYWSLRYAPDGTPSARPADIVGPLQEAMDRSVRRRINDGQPTALYLSGGLGSTAIAASTRTVGRPTPSFTVGFADDPNPETPFAGRVARLLGLQHHEIVLGSRDLADAFDDTVSALGHPIGSPAAILQLMLARTVGTHAAVVLSGDGGEEVFGGRMLDSVARRLLQNRLFSQLPSPLQRAGRSISTRTGRGTRTVTERAGYGLSLGLGGSNLFSAEDRSRLLRDPGLVDADVRQRVLAPFYTGLGTDPVNAILNAYLRSALGEESLPRAYRTAAASGLDIRFPLLDREVLAMAAALPGALKVRRVGGSLHTRWPLRAMLRGVLPPPLVHRPKRGMPAPLDAWLGGPGRLFLERRTARLLEDANHLFRPEAIESLRAGIHRRRGAAIRLWALFFLDEWLHQLRSLQRS